MQSPHPPSRSVLAALALLAPACSAALEVVGTADDRGAIGGEVSMQFGLGLSGLGGGGRTEQTIRVGGAVSEDGASVVFGYGTAAVEGAFAPGTAHRFGVEGQLITFIGTNPSTIFGLRIAWSPLFVFGDPPGAGYVRTVDRLGPVVSASLRFDRSDHATTRAVFGVGARFETASRGL